jgi:hypothetical protein
MASNVDDDEIVFIQEIKHSIPLSRTPKTPLNKKWRQPTLTNVRSPLVAANLNQINAKSEFTYTIGRDIKDFDLNDLSLLSPQVTRVKGEKQKNLFNNCEEIIAIDDDDVKPYIKNELKSEPMKNEIKKSEKSLFEAASIIPSYIKNELKSEPMKNEIKKSEKIVFEAASIIPSYINNTEELMALLNDRKSKSLSRKQQLQQQSQQIHDEIANDPNQLQTGFNEDAETAIPAETYTTYEPKKRMIINFFLEF